MKSILSVAAAALFAALALPAEAQGQETQAAMQQARKAQATLLDAKGKEVGTATLTPQPNGVLIEVRVNGLPQGPHAFHIHERGACEPPSFESAGSHFNPTDRMHGMEVDKGPHAGDLPNLHIDANGSGRLSALNPYVTLAKGKSSLMRAGGTAVVIHSGSDDYTSQPSGDAGKRLACGAIEST